MAVILLDQFTDTAVTDLDAHTIGPTNTPATSWTDPLGSGFSHIDFAGTGAIIFAGHYGNGTGPYLNAGVSDCVLTCDLKPNGASIIAGLIGRRVDGSNGWGVWMRDDTNQIELFERTSGSNTVRANASFTVPTSGTVTVTFTFSGTSITADFNGTAINYTSSQHQSATGYGIQDFIGGNVLIFDNFQIDVADAGILWLPSVRSQRGRTSVVPYGMR